MSNRFPHQFFYFYLRLPSLYVLPACTYHKECKHWKTLGGEGARAMWANQNWSCRRRRQLGTHKVPELLRIPARVASLRIRHTCWPAASAHRTPAADFYLCPPQPSRFPGKKNWGVTRVSCQRCWRARRWSPCASSRPSRSICGLSSSSRSAASDKDWLSFTMWVGPFLLRHWKVEERQTKTYIIYLLVSICGCH